MRLSGLKQRHLRQLALEYVLNLNSTIMHLNFRKLLQSNFGHCFVVYKDSVYYFALSCVTLFARKNMVVCIYG